MARKNCSIDDAPPEVTDAWTHARVLVGRNAGDELERRARPAREGRVDRRDGDGPEIGGHRARGEDAAEPPRPLEQLRDLAGREVARDHHGGGGSRTRAPPLDHGDRPGLHPGRGPERTRPHHRRRHGCTAQLGTGHGPLAHDGEGTAGRRGRSVGEVERRRRPVGRGGAPCARQPPGREQRIEADERRAHPLAGTAVRRRPVHRSRRRIRSSRRHARDHEQREEEPTCNPTHAGTLRREPELSPADRTDRTAARSRAACRQPASRSGSADPATSSRAVAPGIPSVSSAATQARAAPTSSETSTRRLLLDVQVVLWFGEALSSSSHEGVTIDPPTGTRANAVPAAWASAPRLQS